MFIKNRSFLLVTAAVAAAVLVLIPVLYNSGKVSPAPDNETAPAPNYIEGASLSSQNAQTLALKDHILCNENLLNKVGQKDPYVVFLSMCDKKDRARVVTGTGSTLDSAWNDADEKAGQLAYNTKLNVFWVKADVVTEAEKIAALDLQAEIIKEYYRFFYRRGI
ncbi:MAG: hypothetical protein FWG03_11085, partial [Clostridiales bacterium]|nr:hypothetical protein [Clostridiales bacterium]